MTDETRPDQAAYDKMLEAVKVIVDQFKLFPHLMDELAQEVEIALIKLAMDRCEGNCAQAAKLLGINRTTLVEKRKRYKMEIKRLSDET